MTTSSKFGFDGYGFFFFFCCCWCYLPFSLVPTLTMYLSRLINWNLFALKMPRNKNVHTTVCQTKVSKFRAWLGTSIFLRIICAETASIFLFSNWYFLCVIFRAITSNDRDFQFLYFTLWITSSLMNWHRHTIIDFWNYKFVQIHLSSQ